MQTVFETRWQRLNMLIAKHGKIADLNRELGWEENNARLYQIHNRSIRSDRGTPYVMGDATAREMELLLGLDEGCMDTPPTLAEQFGQDDVRAKTWAVMEHMAADQLDTAYRLINALAQGKTPDPVQETKPRPPLSQPSEYVKAHGRTPVANIKKTQKHAL